MSLPTGVVIKNKERSWYIVVTYNTAVTANTTWGPWVNPAGSNYQIVMEVNVTAVSGTSPSLNVTVDVIDIVTYWMTLYSSGSPSTVVLASASTGSITSTGIYQATLSTSILPSLISVSASVGGTSPSFTISVILYIVEVS